MRSGLIFILGVTLAIISVVGVLKLTDGRQAVEIGALNSTEGRQATAATATTASADSTTPGRVHLVADQREGILRIVIDGKEIAWFDTTGLYVRGDLEYKGVLQDGLPRRGDTPGAQ